MEIVTTQDISSALSAALNAYVHGHKAIGKTAVEQWACALAARWFSNMLSGGVFDTVSLGLLNAQVKREIIIYLARYLLAMLMHEGSAVTRSFDAIYSDALGIYLTGELSSLWTRFGGASVTGPVAGANAPNVTNPMFG